VKRNLIPFTAFLQFFSTRHRLDLSRHFNILIFYKCHLYQTRDLQRRSMAIPLNHSSLAKAIHTPINPKPQATPRKYDSNTPIPTWIYTHNNGKSGITRRSQRVYYNNIETLPGSKITASARVCSHFNYSPVIRKDSKKLLRKERNNSRKNDCHHNSISQTLIHVLYAFSLSPAPQDGLQQFEFPDQPLLKNHTNT